MKIEQAKALFMAPYLGQVIFSRSKTDEQYPLILLPQHLDDDRGYLLLRSVNQLKDEEHKICRAYSNANIRQEKEYFIQWLTMIKYWPEHPFIMNNYLIGKGILRPLTYLDETGKPVPLSVEEIIKLGWAQIKTA